MTVETTIDGSLVKALRRQKLWTQEGLAEAAGIHPRTVQRIEKDGVTSLHSCAAIARALEVEPAALRAPVESPAAMAADAIPALDQPATGRLGHIPLALKVVALFWLLMGLTDIARGLNDFLFLLGVSAESTGDSAWWMLPGAFNLYVCWKLLALLPVWRKVAVIYNWVFMAMALAFAMVLSNALFLADFEGWSLYGLIERSVFGPTATVLLYLGLAAAVFLVCLWQNSVLSSLRVRRLFEAAA